MVDWEGPYAWFLAVRDCLSFVVLRAGQAGILTRQLVRCPTILGFHGIVQQLAEILRSHHSPATSQKLAEPLVFQHDTSE